MMGAELIAASLVFGLGAAVGSFLNVVIYRLPAGMSLLLPPSHCPQCQTRLRPYDNVPILGWLWLRGRCRYCRTSISSRYPLVELATGLLFLCLFGAFGPTLTTVGYWCLVSLLLSLALIDFDTMTLPSSLMVLGVLIGWGWQVGLTYAANPTATAAVTAWVGSLAATVLGLWLLSMIRILGTSAFNQDVMGGADAKLAAMLGAWLGWQGVLLTLFLAALIGSLVGGGAIALGTLSRRQVMPFGPFLALSALITLFHGDTLIHAYISLFFPNGL